MEAFWEVLGAVATVVVITLFIALAVFGLCKALHPGEKDSQAPVPICVIRASGVEERN